MNNGYNPYQQQQPNAQQPMYQQQPSLIDKIYGRRADSLQKILTILSMVFLIIAPIAFLYYFIIGIVYASDAYSQEFGVFLNYFFSGVYQTSMYFAFGAILAALKRIISK